MSPPPFGSRETLREQQFGSLWKRDLNDVFADIAPYYDRANNIASVGLWDHFLKSFMSIINVRPGDRVLDVCAGTNAVGIALLKREPSLKIHAIDRSEAMQEVGQQRARALGMKIESTIGDVHVLPFPDNHFDAVTLQYASRHLRIKDVFQEIHRVLKPGGRIYHGDMLRPANPIVEKLYYTYLRACLSFTGFLLQSGPPALNCKDYFISALQMFYSAEELSLILREIGYREVGAKTILAGMIGFHRATKAR